MAYTMAVSQASIIQIIMHMLSIGVLVGMLAIGVYVVILLIKLAKRGIKALDIYLKKQES